MAEHRNQLPDYLPLIDSGKKRLMIKFFGTKTMLAMYTDISFIIISDFWLTRTDFNKRYKGKVFNFKIEYSILFWFVCSIYSLKEFCFAHIVFFAIYGTINRKLFLMVGWNIYIEKWLQYKKMTCKRVFDIRNESSI